VTLLPIFVAVDNCNINGNTGRIVVFKEYIFINLDDKNVVN